MLLENDKTKNKFLVISLMIIFVLFIISIISNLILGITVNNLKDKTVTIIVPFNQIDSYKLSSEKYDQKYLRDMGISFISLRLNNTPETVHKKHELLLSYVNEHSRSEISAVLSDEESIIIKDDLTTAFYYDEIILYPSYDVFEIEGILKTWTGARPLPDQKKKFQLKVNYLNGNFEIINFIEVKNESKK